MKRWQKWALALGLILTPALALTQTAVSPVQTITCTNQFLTALASTGIFTCTSLPAAVAGTAGIAKLHNVPVAIGWPAAVDPNNIVVANIAQASTISAIVGTPEVAVGAAATVTINKAASTVACSAGTALHSGSFNANAAAATDQTLTVTVSTLAAGDRICLQTTGGANWTGGVGIGTITIFLAPTP